MLAAAKFRLGEERCIRNEEWRLLLWLGVAAATSGMEVRLRNWGRWLLAVLLLGMASLALRRQAVLFDRHCSLDLDGGFDVELSMMVLVIQEMVASLLRRCHHSDGLNQAVADNRWKW